MLVLAELSSLSACAVQPGTRRCPHAVAAYQLLEGLQRVELSGLSKHLNSCSHKLLPFRLILGTEGDWSEHTHL